MSWVRPMKHEKYGVDGGFGQGGARGCGRTAVAGRQLQELGDHLSGQRAAYLVTNPATFVHGGTADRRPDSISARYGQRLQRGIPVTGRRRRARRRPPPQAGVPSP